MAFMEEPNHNFLGILRNSQNSRDPWHFPPGRPWPPLCFLPCAPKQQTARWAGTPCRRTETQFVDGMALRQCQVSQRNPDEDEARERLSAADANQGDTAGKAAAKLGTGAGRRKLGGGAGPARACH